MAGTVAETHQPLKSGSGPEFILGPR